MPVSPPIGSVCPYAGQIDPYNGSANGLWDLAACKSETTHPGAKTDNPMNHVEQDGWMLCDGRYLDADAYPELYAVLGAQYGQGGTEAARTFRIPDYRGLFLRGADAGAGLDPDADTRVGPDGSGTLNTVGSLQCDAMQTHTHRYDITQPAAISNQGVAAGTSTSSTSTSAPENPARTTTETRPKNIAVNYIIRFR